MPRHPAWNSTHKTEDIVDDTIQELQGYRLVGELVQDSKSLMIATGEATGDEAIGTIEVNEQLQDEFEVEAAEAAPLAVAPSPAMPSPAEVEEHRIIISLFGTGAASAPWAVALGEGAADILGGSTRSRS